MAIREVPALPADEDVKDLRLALVCYGGVSLAVYMHGVTKEIHKLVVASKAFEQDPSTNPFPASAIEHVYFRALDTLRQREGARTRVVVDIIAGTSAGGINGVILAKALAHNLSQDALRDLWLMKGDIKKLVAMPRAPWLPLRLAAWLAVGAVRGLRSPLDGPQMFRWVLEALEEMDRTAERRPPPGASTLLPEGHALDLKVPITDFYGFNRSVPTFDPRRVKDRWHRHVMRFRSLDGRGRLGSDFNHQLAFAARATSCFPVAFPPVSVRDLGDGWPGHDTFARDFFPIYGLEREPVDRTYFVDGGVLDNFPFRVAFDSIRDKAASVEVDRRLVYIQPDPGGAKPPAPGTSPGLLRLFWGGIAGIPRREPILDDLLAIRDFNERVGRVNAVVRRTAPLVEELLPDDLDPGAYAQAQDELVETAMGELGLSYRAYERLKLFGVVGRFARLANTACRFPEDSNHAFFVRDVLRCWARRRQILEAPEDIEEPTDDQVAFLRSFDLDYRDRRLRFTIKAVSSLYARAGEPGTPSRQELNVAKQALYERLRELSGALAGDGLEPVVAAVGTLFEPNLVGDWLTRDGDPDELVEQFVEEHLAQLDDVRARLAAHLESRLGNFAERCYATVWEATEEWPDRTRRKVLSAYVGFPFWDVIVFPIQEIGDVGELNRVEVVRISPQEALLPRPPGKPALEGIAIMHFGAFFKRRWRENDYLWGRLDGAGRLLQMLLGKEPSELHPAAFRAIAGEERSSLGEIGEVFDWVEERARALEESTERTPVPA
jgi:patatin-related protein